MIHLSPTLEMLRSHFISPRAAHYASCRERLSTLGSDFINRIFSSCVKLSQCRREGLVALRQAALVGDIVLSLNAHGCCNLASVSFLLVAMKAQQSRSGCYLSCC